LHRRYNNFLRLRLAEDGFDVFAVGLEDVPSRDDWIANPKHKQGHPDPEQPVFTQRSTSNLISKKKVSVQFFGAQLASQALTSQGWFFAPAMA
jgi:hypothetical protein